MGFPKTPVQRYSYYSNLPCRETEAYKGLDQGLSTGKWCGEEEKPGLGHTFHS
jgi:hypothetical protein